MLIVRCFPQINYPYTLLKVYTSTYNKEYTYLLVKNLYFHVFNTYNNNILILIVLITRVYYRDKARELKAVMINRQIGTE